MRPRAAGLSIAPIVNRVCAAANNNPEGDRTTMRDEIVAGQVRSRETKGRRECRLLDLRGPRKKSRPLRRTRVVLPIGRILFTRLPIEADRAVLLPDRARSTRARLPDHDPRLRRGAPAITQELRPTDRSCGRHRKSSAIQAEPAVARGIKSHAPFLGEEGKNVRKGGVVTDGLPDSPEARWSGTPNLAAR